MSGRYAVVTTHARPDDFRDCLVAIKPQVDFVIVVAHGMPEYVWDALGIIGPPCQLLPYYAEVPNISAMWNLGLESAHFIATHNVEHYQAYNVAVLNDDAIVPPDWFERVTNAMWAEGAAAGCVYRAEDHRMPGYAFILDGMKGLRLDEQFQWWYGDTDLQRRAEDAGGVAFARGPDVEHRHPNQFTNGVLAEIAGQDHQRYKEKWG